MTEEPKPSELSDMILDGIERQKKYAAERKEVALRTALVEAARKRREVTEDADKKEAE